MRLQNYPSPPLRVVEYVEQQIPVPIGCVVSQPLHQILSTSELMSAVSAADRKPRMIA
jgi:hypothetical protein